MNETENTIIPSGELITSYLALMIKYTINIYVFKSYYKCVKWRFNCFNKSIESACSGYDFKPFNV